MQTHEALQLDEPSFHNAREVYRAINHDLRRKILELIHEKKKMMVTDIYRDLQLEQSVASQHLAILRQAKFVITERQGRVILYSVNYDRLKEIFLVSKSLADKTIGKQ